MPESVKWTIISTVLLGVIGLIIKAIEMIVTHAIEKVNHKNDVKTINENFSNRKVIDNSFFGKMNNFIIEIKHTFPHNVDSTNKTKALYNLMINKYIIYKTFFESLSRELDEIFRQCDQSDSSSCCIIDNETLFKKVIKYFRDATCVFKRYYMLSDVYSPEEKEILKYVIQKFMEWHEDRIILFEKFINEKCYSDEICSKNKINQILDNLEQAFSDTIGDAKNTLPNLNGELSGKIFTNVNLFVNKDKFRIKIFEYNNSVNSVNNNRLKHLLDSGCEEDDNSEFLVLSQDFEDSLMSIGDFSGIGRRDGDKKLESEDELF